MLDEVAEWHNRPLDICYPLGVKVRDEGFVRNKAVYIALGIRPDGTKEILGIWIEQTEGAKFWLRAMNELKNRGIGDILIAVVDGLKGFPEAINAVFPLTVIQTCIVHLIRHSLEFVSWKDRKLVVPALKAIYRAKNAEAGLKALAEFETSFCGQRYPAHRPELAAQLGARRAVLRLPRKRAADHLHDERDRGAERQAPSGRSR